MSIHNVVCVLPVCLVVGLTSGTRADQPLAKPGSPAHVDQRLAQMEARIKALLEDVQALRKEVKALSEGAEAAEDFQIITLRNADAASMVKILKEVYQVPGKPPIRIVADPRSNSIILHVSEPTFNDIRKIVQVLEETTKETDKEKPKPKAPPQIKGVDPALIVEYLKGLQRSSKK